MRFRVVSAAVAVVVGLAAAGFTSSGSASPRGASDTNQVRHRVTTGRPVASTQDALGDACRRTRAIGQGNFGETVPVPVMTAIARSPLLTEIAHAIRRAGLTSTLNSAKAITIFAPENAAFAALGHGNLTALLADKSDLTKVVKYHVVRGRHSLADLASGKHLTTLLGTVIDPEKSRRKYRVNNAQVVCGNLQTANATIYIVNKVLVPIP